MVEIDVQSADSGKLTLWAGSLRDDPSLQAWLTRDLARRNNAVLREQLPTELQALVMLFKA